MTFNSEIESLLLGGGLLDDVGHVRPDLVDVPVGLHPTRQATVVTVPDLRPLVRPGLEAGVVDALVAVLADQEVLALVGLRGALITDNAGLALVADPAVLLVVVDQLGGVNPTARVDALATLATRNLEYFLSDSSSENIFLPSSRPLRLDYRLQCRDTPCRWEPRAASKWRGKY